MDPRKEKVRNFRHNPAQRGTWRNRRSDNARRRREGKAAASMFEPAE